MRALWILLYWVLFTLMKACSWALYRVYDRRWRGTEFYRDVGPSPKLTP